MKESGAGSAPERAVEDLGGVWCVRSRWSTGSPPGFRAARCARCAASGGSASVHRDRRLHAPQHRPTSSPPSPAPRSTSLHRHGRRRRRRRRGAADVALVDSGVSPVGSLAGRVVNGPDFSDDARVDELRNLDAFGHGTHLAGIVAAVAPTPASSTSRSPTATARPRSAGCSPASTGSPATATTAASTYASSTSPSARRAKAPTATTRSPSPPSAPGSDGLVVVASAGNGGAEADGLDSPAHDPYLVAVGALDSGATASLADDAIAPFSSRGSASRAPDVVAPGTAIVSERVAGSFLDEAFPAARIDGGFRGSGTSQAAADGLRRRRAARRQIAPNLDPDEVKALLRAGAHRLPGTDTSLQGAGVVDAAASAALGVPRRAEQRFPLARLGGWLRGRVGNQFAVENLKGSRWSGSRWSGSRWSGSRWSGSRWSGSRWSGSRWSGSRWSGSRWSSVDW